MRSSVLGLQWIVLEDSLQVCRSISKEFETPITQKRTLFPVLKVFDPLGLLAPFSDHMRQLLKRIWTKNGHYCDNSEEPNEEQEFLKWKDQRPEAAKTSISRRRLSAAKNNVELHVFADASEDRICAVAYIRLQPKEKSADLAFTVGKSRVAPMRHF